MSEQRSFTDRGALDTALAAHIAGALRRDIDQRGNASLAVSGGRTPKSLFAQLSRQQLDWSKVYITLVDERWVEPGDPDSNERLVRENLLQNAAADAHFIGLKSGHATAAEGLAEVTTRLAHIPLPFTCVVLGMGGDGHTASWFPRASNLGDLLDPGNPHLLGSCDPVTAPHQRITLTLPVVMAAGDIIVHITGEDKRTVLAEALEKHYPIAAVTEQDSNPVSIWWAP